MEALPPSNKDKLLFDSGILTEESLEELHSKCRCSR
jgi:hypothetical protein